MFRAIGETFPLILLVLGAYFVIACMTSEDGGEYAIAAGVTLGLLYLGSKSNSK